MIEFSYKKNVPDHQGEKRERLDKILKDLKRRQRVYEIIQSCFISVMFLILLTLACFLGFFAFFTPDPEEVYYVPGLSETRKDPDVALAAAKQLNLKVGKDFPLNMASVFHVWFVMGFWTVLNFAVITAMALISSEDWKASMNRFRVYLILIQVTVGLFLFVWIFLGVAWRFSDEGRAASGDNLLYKPKEEGKVDAALKADSQFAYLKNSGKFLSAFYLYIMPLILLYAMTASLVTLMLKPTRAGALARYRNDEEEEDGLLDGSY